MPFSVGGYFDKIACFCFNLQVLQPHERVDMPVTFYVDPKILDDRETRDVTDITLSYTMFPQRSRTTWRRRPRRRRGSRRRRPPAATEIEQ